MEFVVIESSARKKPVAVMGRIDGDVQILARDGLVKRTLEYLLKSKIEFESRDGDELVIKRIGKGDDEYLRYLSYKLEPPLRLKMWGEATVRDFKYGMEKIWKTFVDEKVPE